MLPYILSLTNDDDFCLYIDFYMMVMDLCIGIKLLLSNKCISSLYSKYVTMEVVLLTYLGIEWERTCHSHLKHKQNTNVLVFKVP